MRTLLGIALAATVLWSGYWHVGARAIEAAVAQWFAEQPAGLASNAGVSVQGIPNRFDLTVTEPVLTDPASGMTWQAPFAQVYAMTWKPWHLIAALPSGQEITLADQAISVSSDKIFASLLLHPGKALTLNETVAEAHGVVLTSTAGWKIGVEKAVVSTREDVTRADTHRLGLAVTGIAPDARLMAALTDTDLPALLDEIFVDAHAGFTAPLDRYVAQTRPRLALFELNEARVSWGALRFSAQGALTAGPDGLAKGEIALRVEGWRRLPKILAALGLVKPDIAPTVERALEVMAAQGGNLEVVQVVLKCADGQMSLGPLPLGPAPRLF